MLARPIRPNKIMLHSFIPIAMFVAVSCGPFDGCAMSGSGDTTSPDGVELVVAFDGLSFTRPVDLQYAPGREGELFVVEQSGQIYVFDNDPAVTESAVFLDIRSKVNDRSNEQGLLGLAFHPHFDSNGFFFVNYTATDPNRTVIERYQGDPGNPLRADPASARIILEIEQPFGNHNGGQVAFGPDGFLYIGMGDGGSGGDPTGNGQNLETLLGALLRIDIDGEADGNAYRIPADNPFVGQAGARPEIYAFGLRNPWRFSFDPETDRIWTGDVGQNAFEEVNIVERGGNYGWNTMEASVCFSPNSGCDQGGLILPVAEYGRSLGVSVTGGFVYRGSDVPELEGKYVFADYATGRVWTLTESNGSFERDQLFDTNLEIASFGVDANRELYACAFDGKIYRFATEF